MHIVLMVHPDFSPSTSMPRFANFISTEMQELGHTVERWAPLPFAYRLPAPGLIKKWFGYIDLYCVFPLLVKLRLIRRSKDVIFVFTDQALGPWVSLVAKRPHVVHVHDFMALCSALGEYEQNPTGWTGRKYQSFIRRGFGKARHFISVSENTQKDLHRFLPRSPDTSEVVYNSLNFPYHRVDPVQCRSELSVCGLSLPTDGFLIHVGGNQWYKNREGVIELYLAYADQTESPLPLWMVGSPPTEHMQKLAKGVSGKADIRFLTGLSNQQLRAAYSSARLLLFPSLAEGFGWPIAEAMACGCLTLTTNKAPMTEVGGHAAFYIPPRPVGDASDWAIQSGQRIAEILSLSSDEVHARRQKGYAQVARFDTMQTLNAYERIYQHVLARGSQ